MAGTLRPLILIDTNIAIDLRDGDAITSAAVLQLDSWPLLSIVSQVELEGGIHRDRAMAALRRRLTDRLLATTEVVELTHDDVRAYGRIVEAAGFDRRRILDRLIAAQCLTRNAALVTRNGPDFADIEGLSLIHW